MTDELFQVDGLNNERTSMTSVTVKHYYKDVFIEGSDGKRYQLDYVEVDDLAQWSRQGRELTKAGKPKGTYAYYIPQYDGGREPITYRVIPNPSP